MKRVKEVVFGTDPGCDVRINGDKYVSPKHCRVWMDEHEKLWAEDLGSANGTWLGKLYTGTRVRGVTSLSGHHVMYVGRTAVPITRAGQMMVGLEDLTKFARKTRSEDGKID